MGESWICVESGKLSSDRKNVIEELLIRGRESANQLRRLMVQQPTSKESTVAAGGLLSAEDLSFSILSSFTDTLSVLNSTNSYEEDSSIICGGETSKSTASAASTDNRGCPHKRRKTSKTWTTVTAGLIDDGRAWRKYGQKEILNAKHPRNYYRCSHKYDKGCQATKQVQRSDEDDPELLVPMYRTTYSSYHTCCCQQSFVFPHDDDKITLDPLATAAAAAAPKHYSSSTLVSFQSSSAKIPIQDVPAFFPSSSTDQPYSNYKLPAAGGDGGTFLQSADVILC